jgi:hypothetical protein
MPEVVPPPLVDLLHQLLAPIPRNIWHSLTYSDAFRHHLQTAVNLNEFQYETLLLASCILQRYGENLVFSRRHLDSLKIQLQENLEVYFNQTKLLVNERKIYFICIGRPRHSNPKMQMRDNTIRVLCPCAADLTPQQRNQIQLLCNERKPPPPEPEPQLLDEDEDDNEQGFIEEEALVEEQQQNVDEIIDHQQQLHPY